MKKHLSLWLCFYLLCTAFIFSSAATEIQTEEQSTMIQTENGIEFSKYYLLEDFKKLSLDSITHSVTSEGTTAVFTLDGGYTDDGVLLHAQVKDKELVFGNEKNSLNDYYELVFQIPATSSVQKDYAYKLTCFADGRYILWQKNATEMVEIETPSGFTYTAGNYTDGYGADIFIPYSMLLVDMAHGLGNFRFIMSLRNVNADINAFSESRLLGTHGDYPNTWFVLDEAGKIVRRDYDSYKLCDVAIPETKEILGNLAEITPQNGRMQQSLLGATAVFDEAYGLGYGFPTDLFSITDYVFAPRGENTVTAVTDGYVLLAVPMNNGQNIPASLEADGWTCLADYCRDYLQFGNKPKADYTFMIAYYAKHFSAGETFTPPQNYSTVFGAHTENAAVEAVYTSEPYIIRLDGSEPAFYQEAEQLFACGPSLDVTKKGTIYASYMSGGTTEPHIENFMVIVRSVDGGKTWQRIAAFDTWQNKEIGGIKETFACEFQYTYDAERDRLQCFFWQRNGTTKLTSLNSTHSANTQTWMVTIENPDAENPDDVTFTNLRSAFPGIIRNRALILSDGTWLQTCTGMTDQRFNKVYASVDGGDTWIEQGEIYAPLCRSWDEIMFVEKLDGTIWATYRTSEGVVYQNFSFDNGKTWTISTPANIKNANSRFNITRLPSGALIMVYSDNASTRLGMTVALSYDDGETFTNYYCLYPTRSSYPDVALDADGRIHIIFDAYRTSENVMRADENGNRTWAYVYHAALTEEEILSYAANGKTKLLSFGDSYLIEKYWAVYQSAIGTYGAVNLSESGKGLSYWQSKVSELPTYAPENILVNLGLREILFDAESGESVAGKISSLLADMQKACPDSDIYICEMLPVPAYPDCDSEIALFNAALSAYVESDITGKLKMICYKDKLVSADGTYEWLFLSDGLHLNVHAYGAFTNEVWKATGLTKSVESMNIITRSVAGHLCNDSCGYCEFNGSGTASDPFRIDSLDAYHTFAKQSQGQTFAGKVFRLDTDITLGEDNAFIYRLGSASGFAGTLDGNGHTVTLNITAAKETHASLMHTLAANGTVKNLTVRGNISSAEGYVGGIVGHTYGRIENCKSYVTIESSGKYVAGVAARAYSGAVFTDCLFGGTVLQTNDMNYAGGITSYADDCSFIGCVNEGEISGGRYSIGGIAGRAALVTVQNCSNKGTLTALESRGQVGGIVGELVSGDSVISECNNSGMLKGGSSVADLVGIVNIGVGNTLTFIGGTASGIIECTTAPTDMFYGTLKTGTVEKIAAATKIDSADALVEIMNDSSKWSGNYKLTDNIDLTGKTQNSIGNATTPFSGTFDGDGHVVKGLNVANGLFGVISGATIKNLTVEGTVNASANNAAGIVGLISNNGTVQNCINKAVVISSASRAAGIVGGATCTVEAGNVIVENCKNMVAISGKDNIGGIVGRFDIGKAGQNGTYNVRNCVNYGTVTASQQSGGLMGFYSNNAAGTTTYIENNLNAGDVIAKGGVVGGICGNFRVYSKSDMTVVLRNCMNTGDIITSASDAKIGGIVGAGDAQPGVYTFESNYNSGSVANANDVSEGAVAAALSSAAIAQNNYALDLGETHGVTDYVTLVTADNFTEAATFVGFSADYWIFTDKGPELLSHHKHEIVYESIDKSKHFGACYCGYVSEEEEHFDEDKDNLCDACSTLTKEILGDIDGDGRVTIKDALDLIRVILNDKTIENGDVNGDGKVGLADVIRIMKLVTK